MRLKRILGLGTLVAGAALGQVSVSLSNIKINNPPGTLTISQVVNSSGRALSLQNSSGAEIFGVNGSAASVLPNVIFTAGGIDPYTDNLVDSGGSNAAWANSWAYNSEQHELYLCPPGTFNISQCPSMQSTGGGNINLFTSTVAGGGTLGALFSTMVYNSFSGQQYTQFNGSVIPYTNTTFDLGTNILSWNHAFISELINTGSTISLNGQTYTLPSSSTDGILTNTGGILSWGTGGSGGCPPSGGASWQILYWNSASSCSASPNLIFYGTNATLEIANQNLAAPNLEISQTAGNSTGRIMSIFNYSGAETFGINGAGASVLPNYIFSGGMVPFGDNLYSLGGQNAAWSGITSYTSFQQQDYLCSAGFTTVDCPYLKSTAAGEVMLFSGSSIGVEVAEFLVNPAFGQFYAQFNGSILPLTTLTRSLGSNSLVWQYAYIGELLNSGALMSINGVSYTWPSSYPSGTTVLTNNAGTLSWAPGGSSGGCPAGASGQLQYYSGGVCAATPSLSWNGSILSINGLAAINSISGTANEINVSPSGSSVALSTPQQICTTCSVTFGSVNASTVTANGFSASGGGGNVFYSPNFTVTSGGALTGTTAFFSGQLEAGGPGYFPSGIFPIANLSGNVGSSSVQFGAGYFGSLLVAGGAVGVGSAGVAIPSGAAYIYNGQNGRSVTITVRNSAGTGTCTLVFGGGVLVPGGTC